MSTMPRCPECLRTQRRSIVSEAGRSKLTVGTAEITTTRGKSTYLGGTQTTITYRCSIGHSWSEATTQRKAP